jgi:glycolate dehydrogenase FAD-binding subunit
MGEPYRDLADLLASVAGREQVVENPALKVDGVEPALLVKPSSADELARCMDICFHQRAPVIPAGLMTWLNGGNPVARATVVLSTQRMNRVIEYSPPDLTATVEAGLPLSELNAVANRHGQWLPLDPPGGELATLGAVAACASSGPLRGLFGTPRDYVLGLRLIHADGAQSRSGGKVVKNVAGYDMNKLYVGSFGTLAMLSELTLKLRPLPEAFSTVVVAANNQATLLNVAATITASEAQPASLILASSAASTIESVVGGEALLVRFVGAESDVRYQEQVVLSLAGRECRVSVLGRPEADAAWRRITNLDTLGSNCVLASVPISVAASAYSDLSRIVPGAISSLDLGTGLVRLAFDVDDAEAGEKFKDLRACAVRLGGTLFIERAATDVRAAVDAWGDPGETASLMKAIKAKFDPLGLLNPGRFVAGI